MTTLAMQEEERIEIIQRVFRGEVTVSSAAVVGSASGSVTGSRGERVGKEPREWFMVTGADRVNQDSGEDD